MANEQSLWLFSREEQGIKNEEPEKETLWLFSRMEQGLQNEETPRSNRNSTRRKENSPRRKDRKDTTDLKARKGQGLHHEEYEKENSPTNKGLNRRKEKKDPSPRARASTGDTKVFVEVKGVQKVDEKTPRARTPPAERKTVQERSRGRITIRDKPKKGNERETRPEENTPRATKAKKGADKEGCKAKKTVKAAPVAERQDHKNAFCMDEDSMSDSLSTEVVEESSAIVGWQGDDLNPPKDVPEQNVKEQGKHVRPAIVTKALTTILGVLHIRKTQDRSPASLQETSDDETFALGSKYSCNTQMSVLASEGLDSLEVATLKVGTELTIIKMRAGYRALIRTSAEDIEGWISTSTRSGFPLLTPLAGKPLRENAFH